MQEQQPNRQAVRQQRQITRFDHALPDKVIPVQAHVLLKLAPFVTFLGAGLDHLDARNRFFQAGVGFAELVALQAGDRVQRTAVTHHQKV